MSRRNRSAAHRLVAAAVPAASAFIAATANAAPTASLINLGPANGGAAVGTVSGWTAFKLVATADTGDVITALDFSAGGHGIFGSLLQRWVYYSGYMPSPTRVVANNSVNVGSLDTHFVTLSTQVYTVAAPFSEDNPLNLPKPPGDGGNAGYGAGTFLHGAFAIDTGLLSTQTLAYIVLKDGTVGSASFGLAEQNGGDFTFNLSTSVPEPTGAAAAATAAATLLLGRRKCS
jgi:hypothetical protein